MELQDFKTGTWNVRSIYRTGTLTTVVSELDRYGLALLAVQETRWPGIRNLKTQKATFFYCGGNSHEKGVGFLVSDNILSAIKTFVPINDRICYIVAKGRWFDIAFINCYAQRRIKILRLKTIFIVS